MNQKEKGGSRTARLLVRITPEKKGPFLKAPARTLREHEVMTLSTRDRKVFIASLLNAPAPGFRLRKAAECYKKQSGK